MFKMNSCCVPFHQGNRSLSGEMQPSDCQGGEEGLKSQFYMLPNENAVGRDQIS